MAVIRTRFIFWLFKAYFKKWGKLFLVFFIFGLLFFLLILNYFPLILRSLPIEEKRVIGINGVHTINDLPESIIYKTASGLTKVDTNGNISPDLAESWDIKDNGKSYLFKLKRNIKFSDGTPFTSKNITYAFKDVTITRPDDYIVIFKLKDAYAPFLVTVSKPILINGFIGTGKYVVSKVELNGNFIKTLKLSLKENKLVTETYLFYPTNESLKTAFVLGEVNEAYGIMDTKIDNTNFNSFPNLEINKSPNYSKLITLFFNTEDPVLSDKKWRSGLSYTLPDEFTDGIRAYSLYPPNVYFYNDTVKKVQDITHAKLLIDSALESASSSAMPDIKLKAQKKYLKTAEIIKNSFLKVGLNLKIEAVDVIPDSFQLYLGEFNVPIDPDQYTLWHSGQSNNITRFKNLRIDKLLEDGRRSIDRTERVKIYYDFQKYISDESPAVFLYFPIEYSLNRV